MRRFLIVLLLLFTQNIAAIDGVYEVTIKKYEQKRQSQWSLGDWLFTKRKIALMDQWLALNTENNLFELVLTGSNFELDEDSSEVTKTDENIFATKLFVTILGFSYSSGPDFKDFSSSKIGGLIRLFGSSQQTTHINVGMGKLELETEKYGNFSDTFYEVEGDLYLFSFLGLSGSYLNYDSSNDDFSLDGEISTYGAFLEVFNLRLFYNQRREAFKFDSTSVTHKGPEYGISLIL